MISSQFLKSSLIYTVVGALPYASGFLLLPWFTAYLTPSQFGINALYISLMYFIQIVATLGMDMSSVIIHYDYKDKKDKLGRFLGTIFTSLLVMGAFTAIFFAAGGFRLVTLVADAGDYMELLPFGLITIFSAVFNSVFKTYSGLLIYFEKPYRFLWINLSNFIITIGSSLALLYIFPFTLNGPIFGRMIPAIFSALVSLWFVQREFKLSFHSEFLRQILKHSAPLFIYTILTWVISYIDRFLILGVLKDPVQVAIFDFSVKLVLFLDLVMTGLVNTINPKVYRIWKDQDLHTGTPEVNRYYHGLIAFFLLIIPSFVIMAPLLIPFIIHNEIYYEGFLYIAVLSAGYITRVWFFMFLAPVMFFKQTRSLPKVFLLSALFEIGAGLLMIRYFGLEGAIWTFFLVKPVQALFLYFESRKIFTFRFNPVKMFLLPLIYVLTVVVTQFFITPENRIFIHLAQLALCIILVSFSYRRELYSHLIQSRSAG